MKNKYSQESPDFSEDSHDSLVAFIKQNKPIAPPPALNFEQQLFAEISKYPQPKPNQSQNQTLKRWLPWALGIPIAIATGIGFNWAANRSTYQIAGVPNQVSESEQAEIEQSLISSWNVTDDSVYLLASNSSDGQILNELTPLEYE